VIVMSDANLVLSLPQGFMTATGLDTQRYAAHLSPGSGKYFQGRAVLAELPIRDGAPDFEFMDEGGWRDAASDTRKALEAIIKSGKKTKTALSNNAFSCTPVSAWKKVHLCKTGGELLELEAGVEFAKFSSAPCDEGMTPAEIAKTIGQAPPAKRVARIYMVLAPIEFLVLTSLTPAEYAWYATHRPGKKFRQVCFSEVRWDPGLHLVASSVFDSNRAELEQNNSKKTKTLVIGDVFNRVRFPMWVGYDREAEGGLYAADVNGGRLWRFPATIPRNWERAY
jgi:hypothetical protein